jgi:hypothetical protein
MLQCILICCNEFWTKNVKFWFVFNWFRLGFKGVSNKKLNFRVWNEKRIVQTNTTTLKCNAPETQNMPTFVIHFYIYFLCYYCVSVSECESVCVCVWVCVWACVCVCVCVCVSECVSVCVCVCVCVWANVWVCECVWVCVYVSVRECVCVCECVSSYWKAMVKIWCSAYC